jgi:hypothetical protein
LSQVGDAGPAVGIDLGRSGEAAPRIFHSRPFGVLSGEVVFVGGRDLSCLLAKGDGPSAYGGKLFQWNDSCGCGCEVAGAIEGIVDRIAGVFIE